MPNEMLAKIKQEARFTLEKYLTQNLRPEQYRIKETPEGWEVETTYLPANFQPQVKINRYFEVRYRKVKQFTEE